MSTIECNTIDTVERDAMMVVRLPIAIRNALRSAAEAEQRSMSNLAVYVLSRWLEENGHIKPKAKTTKAKGRKS